MAHFREFVDPDFLCNLDFLNDSGEYKEMVVTIVKVTKEEVYNGKGSKELVATVHTKETKPFILSKVNMKEIIRITRKVDTDDWNGIQIELGIVEGIKAFGKIHDVIRVTSRWTAPKVKQIDPGPAIKSLQSAKNVEELANKWSALSVEEKKHNGVKEIKESMKSKLTAK